MDKQPGNKKYPFNRRRFISDTLKLAVIGSIIPVAESCNDKKKKDEDRDGGGNQYPKKPLAHHHRPRNKWSYEGVVMNTKTKVMHLPSAKVYTYYDEIIPKHLQVVSLASWAAQWEDPVRVNKEQSGNILEMISLNQLSKGISPDSLGQAASTLSKAFSKACEDNRGVNPNMYSFRLHELMLQLVALNSHVGTDAKWATFNNSVVKPQTLRKRQEWMSTESKFNERVKYILERSSEYMSRLAGRASRFAFT